MFKDRRIFQRVDAMVNVRYGVRGRDKKKIESLPRNIGGGGVGLCLTEKLSEGTILDLEITVPDNPHKAISADAQVLWTKPFGEIDAGQHVNLYESGIKFIDIDPIAIGRVYSYYRQHKHKADTYFG